MAATYDLGSDVGKVRLEIPDTNIQRPIFSDAEIQYFLDTNKNMQEAIQNRINNLLATSDAFGSVPVERHDWYE